MKKIFILEDDTDIREMITFLLEGQHYEVSEFATLSAFNKGLQASRPDLILLDIMLPDGNGIDICRSLKAEGSTQDIPVVLMSANINNKELLSTIPAQDFIGKPFDIDDFVRRIQRQLPQDAANV